MGSQRFELWRGHTKQLLKSELTMEIEVLGENSRQCHFFYEEDLESNPEYSSRITT
jgi:hypothetical protein